jgi:hypothetical protein
VTMRVSDNSYNVQFADGSIKHIHANKLRIFLPQVANIGVIFEGDEEFGGVDSYPAVAELEPTDNNIDRFDGLDLTHLSNLEQQQLRALLRRFDQTFNDRPGVSSVGEHAINLVPDFKPRKLRAYRVPDKLRPAVDRQIDLLLAEGKIRPSHSEFAHPIVCIAKKGNVDDVRICVDYRYINSGTVNDAFPLPDMEALLRRVSACSYVTLLDCSSGYNQIKMKEEDIYKTGFICHRGFFENVFMPFGLKCSGNTFVRTIDTILRDHADYAGPFVDDIAVHSLKFSEHLIHLENTLGAFEKVGMTLKLSKCRFAQPKVDFLGHHVGSGTLSVIEDKVAAISRLPEPTSKKAVRSFLGMCNFYRTYIPNYSELALPLTDLTKAKGCNKFTLNDEQRASFETLKKALSNPETLASPQYDKPFHIFVDASLLACGAVLSQLDDQNHHRPIAFASKKFNPAQTRYSVIERESFAVIFALQKFDLIIFGSKIILHTDHNPLQYIATGSVTSAKLTRWALHLQRYDLEITYIAGRDNVVSDHLSRAV